MLRKLLARRLERRLAQAEELGVISPADAATIRERAKAADWMMIMEMIMMIIELIMEWMDNRE